jgi:hypothetical protein
MTLRQAITTAVGEKVYSDVKNHLMPPEQVRLAAIRLFINGGPSDVTNIIRVALLMLEAVGNMPEMDKEIVLPTARKRVSMDDLTHASNNRGLGHAD